MTQPATAPTAPAALSPIPPRTPVWPRPGRAAAPVVLAAAAVAGATAAVAVPLGRFGLGWLVTGLVLVGLRWAIVRGAGPDASRSAPTPDPAAVDERPARTRLTTAMWTAIALGLLLLVTVRASEWLAALCVLSAAVAGSLAVAGGRSLRGLLLGAVAVPALAVGALPWACRGVAALNRRGGAGAPRIVGAALVGVALLAVFTPLLAGADAAFGHLVENLIPTLSDRAVARTFLFVVVGLATIGAGYLLSAPARPDVVTSRAGRLRRIEWALPVGLLFALFGTFVVVTLSTLFGGAEHVLRTTGLTYAEYARSGFWQLLLVSVLTLPVIMVAGRYAGTATAADRGWLRGLLGGLAVLTLVIVASALSRMWAYQQAYGFTVLRVLVSAMELWLGVVYLLVLAAGRRLRAIWLPRAVVGTGLAALLALGVLNPDRFIAEQNIQRWEETGTIDLWYLRALSADAVPALSRLPEPMRTCAIAHIATDLVRNPDDWRGWNVSREAARVSTASLAGARPDCPPR